MGNICNHCKKKAKKKIVLLLVGLDNAGKTAAAKGLAGEPVDSVIPTVGFSIINLTYLNYIVKVFDLGGGPNIRGIWHRYFVDVHGVIFVVDSSDVLRLDEAKTVLKELLSHEKITRKPILVLANKQDNEDALDEVDIIEQLELESIANGNECPTLVESCSAVEANMKLDSGIKRGYEWLVNYVVRNYEILNKRVEEDVATQIELENKLRMEQMEKIRLMKEAESRAKLDVDAIESYSNYERKLNDQNNSGPDTINNLSTESDVSENSSDSFPPVYHVKDEIILERPKSVVQIVRQQLELNNVPSKKSIFVAKANKTAPLLLYNNPPQSATAISRQNYDIDRRRLKSAGDEPVAKHNHLEDVNNVTDLPNVPIPNDEEFHRELFTMMKCSSKSRVGPLEDAITTQNKKENGFPFQNGDRDFMKIVNDSDTNTTTTV